MGFDPDAYLAETAEPTAPAEPLSFTTRASGYFPVPATDPRRKMEGGYVGAGEWHGAKLPKQEPLYTLDQFRRGEAPYVSVAMDNSPSNPLPYGAMLESPDFEGVPFRVMDTGSAFNGQTKKYGGAKGLTRADIARDDVRGANHPENNRPVRFRVAAPAREPAGEGEPGPAIGAFDPDAFLAQHETPVSKFDPDAFLAKQAEPPAATTRFEPPSGFDPDAFLAQQQQPEEQPATGSQPIVQAPAPSWLHQLDDVGRRVMKRAVDYFGSAAQGLGERATAALSHRDNQTWPPALQQQLAAAYASNNNAEIDRLEQEKTDRFSAADNQERDGALGQLSQAGAVSVGALGKEARKEVAAIPTDKANDQSASINVPAELVTLLGMGGHAAVDPYGAGMIFALGTGQHLADRAREAGQPDEQVEEARALGEGLGAATAALPLGKVQGLMRGLNVNPFVKNLGEGLSLELERPDVRKQLLRIGIEGLKTAGITGAAGGAYQMGQNEIRRTHGEPEVPLMKDVPETTGLGALLGGTFGAIGEGNRPYFQRPLAGRGEIAEPPLIEVGSRKPEAGGGVPRLGAPAGAAPSPAQVEFESQLATQEGVKRGAPTVVLGANGAEFPAAYAWAPRALVQPSHSGETLAPNPAYPLTNTRDYSDQAEKDKALATRNGWDPRRAITDSPDAAVGPPMVARVIDEQGIASLAVVGGNNRQWAMQNLSPEQWAATQELSNAKAPAFGLEPSADPDAQIVRTFGSFDFRKPGERERLQGMVDALNPSPGMVQGTAKRAALANVPLDRLGSASMEMAPADAQAFVRSLIADGTLDRNRTSATAASPSEAQDFTQRLLVNAAYRVPAIAEARGDTRPGAATMRGMIDAAVPALIGLRGKGEEGVKVADSIARAFSTVLDATKSQGAEGVPQALATVAAQAELDPVHAPAQEIARQLAAGVVTDAKGRLLPEPTIANARAVFERVAAAVRQHSDEPNLWGDTRSVAGTVLAATGEARSQKPEASGGVVREGEEEEEFLIKPTEAESKWAKQMDPEDPETWGDLATAQVKELFPLWLETKGELVGKDDEVWPESPETDEAERLMNRMGSEDPRKAAAAAALLEQLRAKLNARIALAHAVVEAAQTAADERQTDIWSREYDWENTDEQGNWIKEHAESYLDAKGVADPARRAGALDEFQRWVNILNDAKLKAPYQQLELGFGPASAGDVSAGRGGAEPAGSAPGRGAGAVHSAEAQAGARALEALARGVGLSPAQLEAAFTGGGETISAIAAKMVGNPAAPVDWMGKRIRNVADFALLKRALRNPVVEVIHYAIVHPQTKRVVASGVAHVGALDQSVYTASAVLRAAGGLPELPAGQQYIVYDGHNHPSGVPEPSGADWTIYPRVRSAYEAAGLRHGDHIVTNGHEFHSLATNQRLPFPGGPKTAAWELLPRHALEQLTNVAELGRVANALRTGSPDHYHVIHSTIKAGVTAIQRLPAGMSAAAMAQAILREASRQGSRNVFLSSPNHAGVMGRSAERVLLFDLKQLLDQAFRGGAAQLTDIATPDVDSFRAAGLIQEPNKRYHVEGLPELAVQAAALESLHEAQALDQTQTPEFRRWFGDSKVVDAEGKPLAVDHGTSAEEDFDVFRIGTGSATKAATATLGAFFTDSPEVATFATNFGHGPFSGPEVKPFARVLRVYLSLQNPLDLTPVHLNALAPKTRRALESIGVDPWLAPGEDPFKLLQRLADAEVDFQERVQRSVSYPGNWVDFAAKHGLSFEQARAGSEQRSELYEQWSRQLSAAVNDAVARPKTETIRAKLMALGYDGIVVTTAFDVPKGATVRTARQFVAFKPGQIKSAVANSGEFDPENPSILREDEGSYSPVQAVGAKGGVHASVPLAGLPDIKIVQMPELVELARDLTLALPGLKRLPKALGYFKPLGNGQIVLDPRIFADPREAAKVLAHEIGHLIDWLPDKNLKRGNLHGRLHSLRKFLQDHFGAAGYSNKELRQELIALTKYWKPYDPATSPKSYVQYRESAVELYADALSVLFNSPATLAKMAPKFYAEFWRGLGTKPEVKQTFFDLQAWLSRPMLEQLNDRARKVDVSFAKGQEIYERKWQEREERYQGFGGWLSRLKQGFFDNFAPIRDRESAVGHSGSTDAGRFLFDEHPLADNLVYRFLERMQRTVVAPAEAAGFSMDELGKLLMFERIANERYEVKNAQEQQFGGRSVLANPQGHTPETARLGLLAMRLNNKMRGQTLLEQSVQRFHDQVFEVMKEAHTVGLFTDDQMKLIAENRDSYATFTPLEYVDLYLPSGFFPQVGSLKEISNPFVATVSKLLTMHRAIQHQRTKAKAVEILTSDFPAEIQRAETMKDATGRETPRKPRERGVEQIMLREAGKPAWYNVPKEIALMFERTEIPLMESALKVLDVPFRKFFYKAYITYNPVFQLWRNPLRDARRSYVNAPAGVGFWSIARQLPLVKQIGPNPALDAVRALVKQGKQEPLVAEMLDNLAITPGEATFTATLGRPVTNFDRMLQQFGVSPAEEQVGLRAQKLPFIGPVLRAIETAGRMNELLPKASAYKVLTKDKGWHPQEAAYYVRNYIGTPNYTRRGKHVGLLNSLVPFVNIWMKGWAADAELARRGYQRADRPDAPGKSAASWWFRMALTSGLWTVLKVAATMGLLGLAMKKLMDGIGDHYKTNYDVIPLGRVGVSDFDPEGKVAFIPIPKDPTDRVISGILYNALRSAGIGTAKTGALGEELKAANANAQVSLGGATVGGINVAASDVPGLNPLLKLGIAWASYAQGQNPVDSYRGNFILSDKEYLAGGWDGVKPMLAWSYQQTGLSGFASYDPNAGMTLEQAFNLPLANGMVKVTDYGYREAQRANETAEKAAKARIALGMPANAQRLAGEYGMLRGLGAKDRTPAQEERYRDLSAWHKSDYAPAEQQLSDAAENGLGPDSRKSLLRALEERSRSYERR